MDLESIVWIAASLAVGSISFGWILWADLRLVRKWAAWRQGKCTHCGYDLRASGAVCPECGRPVRW